MTRKTRKCRIPPCLNFVESAPIGLNLRNLVMALLILIPSVLWAEPFMVVWVYDGDTIKVGGEGRTVRVRLIGIDAPETAKGKHEPGQPYSQNAKKRLIELVQKKTVALKTYGVDDYDRILAEVFVATPFPLKHDISTDTLNVNLQLVREGLAEVYGGRTPHDFNVKPYRQAQAEARQSNRGMWRQGETYVSPRAWKHRVK